jgi:hypothetical protein|tara:strand:- start:85 stop:588 length:504 start_codon:yes stop_codon:yes gene_type:complete
MPSTYTPLFHEILEKVSRLKTKKQKVSYLKENNTASLRMVIKASFDPGIIWALPAGEVPYAANDAPEGTEHTMLASEANKLYHYVQGGNNALSQNKRESMFVQLLEGLHKSEAEILVSAKDKSLHKMYKGLSDNVVKEAFDWDDNYMVVEHNRHVTVDGPTNITSRV